MVEVSDEGSECSDSFSECDDSDHEVENLSDSLGLMKVAANEKLIQSLEDTKATATALLLHLKSLTHAPAAPSAVVGAVRHRGESDAIPM